MSQLPADPTAPAQNGHDADPRLFVDRASGTWRFEDDDGQEMEWDTVKGKWVPVLDEELVKAQQAAYSIQGVDEEAPAAPVVARENKKRKKEVEVDYTSSTLGAPSEPASKKAKKDRPRGSKNTAVFVSDLPLDTTYDELVSRFSKFGLLEENDKGEPKVKMYGDAEGTFNGTALVVYFKEESVDLAIAMLDEAELRIGEGGRMRVILPDYEGEKWKGRTEAKDKEQRVVDKKKASKRIEKMTSKLTDWDDEDGFGPPTEKEERPAPAMARVVVLKHMFTADELAEDASLLLDLKEDVREECEQLGQVTNVILYDKEPEGVMTVKFKDPVSAQACVLKMNGRFFAKRRIVAELFTGRQRFKRSGDAHEVEEEVAEAEKQRLDDFASWLMAEGE